MCYFRLGLIFLALTSLAACTQLPPRPQLPAETAIPAGVGGTLDDAIASAEARHPGQSAFRLVAEGSEAFVTRMQSARLAKRSLDVQTYIWHADITGMFLLQQLLEAADRGVKVRLLVDDLDARAKNAGIAALAAHPGIAVRIFNPFSSRQGVLRMLGEGLLNFGRINHRMHNKSWIADNRIAIVGGRNIGNEYFGASEEVNFVDLDFAMIGPVVRDVSASFDKYWNSAVVYPMESLDAKNVDAAALEKLRTVLASNAEEVKNSRYAYALRTDDAVKRLITGGWPMEWSGSYRFVSDDPLKAAMKDGDVRRTEVGVALVPMVQDMQTDLTVISPYFVPGKATVAAFVNAVESGKRVRVLTNSLVANDVAAVHGGYSRYRKSLLKGGVQLWELKPLTGSNVESSLFGSSGASLHTKALAVDGRLLFVGSYNLDPRSTWLNCEQGVLVESRILAKQLDGIFAVQIDGHRAWQVMIENDKLSWSDGSELFDRDPKATMGRRFQAWLTRMLPFDAQL